MTKWSIRDLWGRLTQKKELNPDMRSMLLDLDGVYETAMSTSVDTATTASATQNDGSQDSRH